MKINYYQNNEIKENYIDIFYKERDNEITSIIDYLNSYEVILGKNGEITKKIFPNEIFYCEMVDRRCYSYLKNEVYQIEFSLKNFQQRFQNKGFIQIGKSLIVNIYKINKIKTDLNMRMRLFLENEEILVLNRSYKKSFMEYLKKIQEGTSEDYR